MTSIPDSWNQIISTLPNPHLLQTKEWGLAKQPFGWVPHYKLWEGVNGQPEAAAQILQRSIHIPGTSKDLCMLYVPKGPLLRDWTDMKLRARVFGDLANFAREQGAFFVKVDPDINVGIGVPGGSDAAADPLGAAVMDELRAGGWRFSNEQVQMANTMLIYLLLHLGDQRDQDSCLEERIPHGPVIFLAADYKAVPH